MNDKYSSSHKLSAEERRELKDSDFGIPETREFPMPDAAHVRAAEDKKKELAHRILLKTKRFGVNVESDIIRKWAEK